MAKYKVFKSDYIDALYKIREIIASNKGHIRETLAYQLFMAKYPLHPVALYWMARFKTRHGTAPTLSKYISKSHLFNVEYYGKAKLLSARN